MSKRKRIREPEIAYDAALNYATAKNIALHEQLFWRDQLILWLIQQLLKTQNPCN